MRAYESATRMRRTRTASDPCRMAQMSRRLMNPGFRRAGLVVLLVGGAYFAALPWINCAFGLRFWAPDLIRICTFGTGVEAFPGPGALWPYLLVAIIYLFAALGVALTKGID